jgi:hypothetical protein
MPPENQLRAGPAPAAPPTSPSTSRGTALADQPWWAAVLLTVADVADRPWLALAVWVVVIGRSVPRALDRVRRGRARSARRASAIVRGGRPRRPGSISAPGPPGAPGIAAAALDISRPSFLGPGGNGRRMVRVGAAEQCEAASLSNPPIGLPRPPHREVRDPFRRSAPEIHRPKPGSDRLPPGFRDRTRSSLVARGRGNFRNARADPARRWIFDAVAQRDLAGVRSRAVGVVMLRTRP